jgi:glucokinase
MVAGNLRFSSHAPGISPPAGAPYPRLVGDVGGTHARFGWVREAGCSVEHLGTYACNAYVGLEAVIAHYLTEQGRPHPASCAIGIATPVMGDTVAMTNRDWKFSVNGVQRRLGVERFIVLNDFVALALALPDLLQEELERVGGGVAVGDAPLALLGPGTGLGVSGVLPSPGGEVPVVGEGGHATLCACDATEDRVLSILRGWFGHVSAERALSGAGLVNLYRAACELGKRSPDSLSPSEVTGRALSGDDQCRVAVALFFGFLGTVAGDLALTLGARGGVYIAGGIVPQLGDWIARSNFRERFEAKGRLRPYLANIPTWVIAGSGSPALRGANRALDR